MPNDSEQPNDSTGSNADSCYASTSAGEAYAESRFDGSMGLVSKLADWTPSQIALMKQELTDAFETGSKSRKPMSLVAFETLQIGSKQIHFEANIQRKQAKELMDEIGRVFIFSLLHFDGESGKCEISLVPGNGRITHVEEV